MIQKSRFKMTSEVWKYVPNLGGVMASSLGRIIKQPKYCPMWHGGYRAYMPKPTYGNITRSNKTAKHSYRGVYYKGIGNVKVHQAVCAAFHGEKPFDKAVVIHLDENAHNNVPENLKWGTQKENLNSPKFIEYCKSRTGENSNYYKHQRKKDAA